MSEALPRLLAVAAGVVLGAIYFGGLWWTVRRVVTSPRPISGLLLSVVFRMGLVLGGFYLVAAGDWVRLLFCLLGFLAARAALVWRARRPPPPDAGGIEAAHAP